YFDRNYFYVCPDFGGLSPDSILRNQGVQVRGVCGWTYDSLGIDKTRRALDGGFGIDRADRILPAEFKKYRIARDCNPVDCCRVVRMSNEARIWRFYHQLHRAIHLLQLSGSPG